jgi:hypothetical protein
MTRTSRVTAVQVPGAQPAAEQATTSTAAADQQPDNGAADDQGASSASGKPETTEQATTSTEFDIEALRAQIRAEEQARAREELASQIDAAASRIQAASTVTGTPAAAAPRTRGDYKAMGAHEVDPTTLTAPVMTRDGWVCPVPPEKK